MVSNFWAGTNSVADFTTETRNSKQEQFLRLKLCSDTTIILPLFQTTRVLNIPLDKVVPVPQMPPWTMGVYNWRGEILWVVDMGHLLGLTPWYQQEDNRSEHKTIVIQSGDGTKDKGDSLGLVINEVEDIEWCNPDEIQSPPSGAVTPELVPFLRGYWLKGGEEILVVLDGEAIIAAMPKP